MKIVSKKYGYTLIFGRTIKSWVAWFISQIIFLATAILGAIIFYLFVVLAFSL